MVSCEVLHSGWPSVLFVTPVGVKESVACHTLVFMLLLGSMSCLHLQWVFLLQPEGSKTPTLGWWIRRYGVSCGTRPNTALEHRSLHVLSADFLIDS